MTAPAPKPEQPDLVEGAFIRAWIYVALPEPLPEDQTSRRTALDLAADQYDPRLVDIEAEAEITWMYKLN